MPKNEKQDEPKFMEIKEDGDLGFNFGDETESKGEKHKKNDQLAILNEELEQAIKEKNYTKLSLLKKKIKTYSIEKRFKLDYSKNTNIDYPQEVINQKGNDHLPAQDDAEYYKSYIYNAISKNDKYNLEILMNFMKNNDIKDHHGNNLVMKATMMNNNIIVKELVNKYGISPNKSNYYGATPLHVAAFNGNADLVKFFLNNNGDVQKTDDAGNSPVDYAKKKNNQQIVQLLSYRQ